MEKFVLAIVIAVAELYIIWKQGWLVFVPHKAKTAGTVTSVDWDGANISYEVEDRIFSIKFKSRKVGGLKEEIKSSLAQKREKSTPIGTKFMIYYDVTNPQNAKVCPGPLAYLMPFLILFSILFVFLY